MHDKAKRRHEDGIKRAVRRYETLRDHGHPEDAARAKAEVDMALDQYADSLLRATEWDADKWGFDSDRWMEAERVQMLEAAEGKTYPKERV